MITPEAARLAAQEFGSRNLPGNDGLQWGFLFRGISRSGLYLFQITVSPSADIDGPSTSLSDGGGGLLPAYLPLVLPLAILALPFLDLTLAFVRRTYAGRWWFVPDKQHLHHRLMERGHLRNVLTNSSRKRLAHDTE